jgi:DNA replication protein DnaC
LAVSALELADIAKNQPERFDYIKKAELLAIDDVGTEPSVVKVWGNEISPFVDTIYYRYDRQKFTIMTSNLSAEDLADKYGERIADRFTEMFDRIAFENYSYRK